MQSIAKYLKLLAALVSESVTVILEKDSDYEHALLDRLDGRVKISRQGYA